MRLDSSIKQRNVDAQTLKPFLLISFVSLAALFSGCKTTSINATANSVNREMAEKSMAPYKEVMAGGYELMLIRPNELKPFFWMDWDKAYRWQVDEKLISLRRGAYKDSAGILMFTTSHLGKAIEIKLFNEPCRQKSHDGSTRIKATFGVDGKTEELCALNLSNPILQNKWYWVKSGHQSVQAETAPYLYLDLPGRKIKVFTGEKMLTADCTVMGTRMIIGQWNKKPTPTQQPGSTLPNLGQLQQSIVEWFMKDNNLTLILPDESHWVFSGAY